MVAKGQEKEEGEFEFNGYGVSVGKDGRVLERVVVAQECECTQ